MLTTISQRHRWYHRRRRRLAQRAVGSFRPTLINAEAAKFGRGARSYAHLSQVDINNQQEEIVGTTVQLPTFSFTTVSTTVSVPDGGTVLLGGIKRLSEGRNEVGVPLLSKLPYVNRLFRNVGIGGLFHDVGKLALSDIIFTNRQARLSNDLQQEVRCHPLIGAALLKHIDFLEPVVDFVLFHHEREDGYGYPYGLKAKEIPPGAKIVSIADCFDAVTTDRPYQKGQSVASAYEILRQGCRRYFCEAYVEVFIEDIEENGRIETSGSYSLLADELVRSAAGCHAM